MPPERVVSLVPSLTESMFDLGLGAALVGITDFCVHPKDRLAGLPCLGGPKTPNMEALLALKPDLVLANREENSRPAVEVLQSAGVDVWLTFPLTVSAALNDLRELAGLFHNRAALLQVDMLERAVEWAAASAQGRRPVRYFCPIWLETPPDGETWWMTFNRQTYMDDLLGLLGGQNVFAERSRRYPLEADLGRAVEEPVGERDTRYPRLSTAEAAASQPDVILLPDEPFPFTQEHTSLIQGLLPESPAVKTGRIALFEGSYLTWHGTRLGKALQVLPGLLE